MLSCKVFSSKYQEVCSLTDAPAVGSGAPQTYTYIINVKKCEKETNFRKIK
jgi:hypothetical protein